jgi:hypothetical protein
MSSLRMTLAMRHAENEQNQFAAVIEVQPPEQPVQMCTNGRLRYAKDKGNLLVARASQNKFNDPPLLRREFERLCNLMPQLLRQWQRWKVSRSHGTRANVWKDVPKPLLPVPTIVGRHNRLQTLVCRHCAWKRATKSPSRRRHDARRACVQGGDFAQLRKPAGTG